MMMVKMVTLKKGAVKVTSNVKADEVWSRLESPGMHCLGCFF